MPIIAKRPASSYSPCPEGLHHAVCVDVVDLGLVASAFGEKHKVRIVWQIEDEDPQTKRRYEARKQYVLSLHEKASLRKDLEAWRGRKFTEQELDGFDLEKLLGVNCQIQVVHDIKEDSSIWANVQAVVPAPRNTPKLVAQDYVRHKDRPKEQGNGGHDKRLENELDPVQFMWLLPLMFSLASLWS